MSVSKQIKKLWRDRFKSVPLKVFARLEAAGDDRARRELCRQWLKNKGSSAEVANG